MKIDKLTQLLALKEESPKDPFIDYAIAMEHQKAGDLDKALTGFQDLTQKHPNYVGTYYHLGKLLERLDKEEEALSIYEQGIEIAKKIGNKHAQSELETAHWELSP